MLSLIASIIWLGLNLFNEVERFLFALKLYIINIEIIKNPGRMPALKRSSIETSATTPYKIKGNEGANNNPRLPEVVISPKLNLSG